MRNPQVETSRTERHDAVRVQLCAYNMAFSELGLRFRWDANVLASLSAIDDEGERVAAYITANHSHLLNAYSAEFLSRAILERKNAHAARHLAAKEVIRDVYRATDLAEA